jgi:hypothetical protein
LPPRPAWRKARLRDVEREARGLVRQGLWPCPQDNWPRAHGPFAQMQSGEARRPRPILHRPPAAFRAVILRVVNESRRPRSAANLRSSRHDVRVAKAAMLAALQSLRLLPADA